MTSTNDPTLLNRLTENPRSFTWLRKIAEANFYSVRRIVRREFNLDERCRVLDVGCGTGELAPQFRGHDYLGLDLSTRYIKYARIRFPQVHFGVSDAANLPVRDGYYDRVLIFGVIHHMDDELSRLVIAEVARVLRPGGRFLLIEDRRELAAWNILGRLVHSLDAGENIRSGDGYRSLVPWDLFRAERNFTFASGFCEYYGFLLERIPPIED